jgi:hypothetical protein
MIFVVAENVKLLAFINDCWNEAKFLLKILEYGCLRVYFVAQNIFYALHFSFEECNALKSASEYTV